ncbi:MULTISPECIES: hypothetical protein [Corynebacterium]|nr:MULTISPECIES: hypothetical protein [Corynebacterium]
MNTLVETSSNFVAMSVNFKDIFGAFKSIVEGFEGLAKLAK